MSHADYHCCAVCDSKMTYGGFDSKTKEIICPSCLKALRAQNLNILDTQELIDWININSKEVVTQTLQLLGFSFCYYTNEVDATLERKGIKQGKGNLE